MTTRNEIAGIHGAQPRTLEERIELAHQLRRRFRLSTSMLIDALDNRAWRAFGSAPNVAILVRPERPNRRQARLVRTTGNGTRDHCAVEKLTCQRRLPNVTSWVKEEPRFGCGVFLKEFE